MKAWLSKLIMMIIVTFPSHASFLERKAEGWHWYEDRAFQEKALQKKKKAKKEGREKKGPEKEHEGEPQASPSAREILASFQKELEDRRIQAVIFPTYANVKAYQELQQQMMERSALFSKRWVEVVMTTPQLDYTLKRPITQVGAQVYDAQKKQILERTIKELSSRYGLFFFFSTGCPYCKTFAPVVKRFSEKYGWPVLAISLDGGRLDDFPDAQSDNGAAAKLGVTSLPTLLAVNPQTGTVLPLSYGYNALDGIEKRLQIFWEQGRIK